MDRRFEARLSAMLAQAEVAPELIDGFLRRLETFVQPFAASLAEPEQRRHTVEYLTGLLSKLERKTGEGDRLPARPGTPGPAEVRRAGALGRSALAQTSSPRRSARSWANPTA